MSSVRTDVLANLAGATAPIFVSLLTVPFYIRLIGTERLGILSIIWILVGYFGLLDFGLSRAFIHKMARSTTEEKVEIFWSSAWGALTIGIFAAILVQLLAIPAYLHYSSFPVGLHDEFLRTSPWIASAAGTLTLNAIFLGSLEVERRFVLANGLQVLGVVVTQALPLAFGLLIAPTLDVVVPAMILGRLATTALLAVVNHRVLGLSAPSRPRWGTIRELFAFGGWIGISSLISPILTSVDQLVIGARLGAGAVPYYSVPYSLASRISLVPIALIRSLFPRMSNAFGKSGETDEQRFWVPLAVALTLVCATGVAVFPVFLELWIGHDFSEHGALVGQFLILGMWFNCLAYLPMARLQAIGRPDIPAKCHIAELVPYLAILFLALAEFGVVGAAIAWASRVTVDCIALMVAGRYGVRKVAEALPGFALLVTGFALSRVGHGFVYSVCLGSAIAVVTVMWAVLAIPEARKRLFARL